MGKRKPTTSGGHRGGCRRLLAPYVGSMWAFLASRVQLQQLRGDQIARFLR